MSRDNATGSYNQNLRSAVKLLLRAGQDVAVVARIIHYTSGPANLISFITHGIKRTLNDGTVIARKQPCPML